MQNRQTAINMYWEAVGTHSDKVYVVCADGVEVKQKPEKTEILHSTAGMNIHLNGIFHYLLHWEHSISPLGSHSERDIIISRVMEKLSLMASYSNISI